MVLFKGLRRAVEIVPKLCQGCVEKADSRLVRVSCLLPSMPEWVPLHSWPDVLGFGFLGSPRLHSVANLCMFKC